jgi:hypothetical protein
MPTWKSTVELRFWHPFPTSSAGHCGNYLLPSAASRVALLTIAHRRLSRSRNIGSAVRSAEFDPFPPLRLVPSTAITALESGGSAAL